MNEGLWIGYVLGVLGFSRAVYGRLRASARLRDDWDADLSFWAALWACLCGVFWPLAVPVVVLWAGVRWWLESAPPTEEELAALEQWRRRERDERTLALEEDLGMTPKAKVGKREKPQAYWSNRR